MRVDNLYNYYPQNGSTPLNVAAQKNHVKVVEVLLAAGANVDLAREVRHCLMVNSKLYNWKDRKAKQSPIFCIKVMVLVTTTITVHTSHKFYIFFALWRHTILSSVFNCLIIMVPMSLPVIGKVVSYVMIVYLLICSNLSRKKRYLWDCPEYSWTVFSSMCMPA